MPQPYNLTNITNSDTPQELFINTNELTGGTLGFFILLSVFVLTYLSATKFGGRIAFATAAFITSGIAVLFRIMGVIGDPTMYASFILVALGYIWLKWGD